MSRSHRRFSRPMIVLLGGLLAIGTLFVLHKTNRTTASITPINPPAIIPLDQPAPPQPLVSPPTPPPAPAIIETQTPQAPTTNPSPLVADVAHTQTPQDDHWANLLNHGTPDAAPPLVTGKGPLIDGQTLMDAGRLLDARKILNDALQSGQLTASDTQSAKSMMAKINDTVIFSPQRFIGDPWGGVYVVRPGDRLGKIAMEYSTTWQLLSRINGLDPKALRAGATIKIVRGPFFAVVNKKAFTMDIYIGALPGDKASMYVKTVEVGLGRDDSTPTGTWAIASGAKLRHPTYYPPEGGAPIEADDPKNPLGGYWIALTGTGGAAVGKTSYGIHGTIDPDSIGKQASMGCIRMGADDISLVFDLMVEGKSTVLVTD